ncbi:alcohol dehydrogenase catalytic domain-containing protein [Demequina lignilytica]|uniref:Alcohol dehydrogenase catalytic domain-containing protein n=1 Tax=Demequina lignilytica TaxID=3051663 RepID=A0AB35MHE6_9MICO|nr:alcohol dehydrogenase catalytic domain-containing protein [Demequina sp. SYSU T0a273]MDN4483135.1 alcohol dehydrogenase catalytic domain-containing protein [Demequina sp. SYSU T0a273]
MTIDASAPPLVALAATVREPGGAPEIAEVRLDALRADEVLVAVAASGVCHTDLTALDGGVGYAFPAVFGHEGAGTVVEVGSAVTRVAAGDRVVLTFDSCGTCRRCRDGHPASCEEFAARNYRGARADGSPTLRDAAGEPVAAAWMAQSSWATHAIARETNVVRIGDHIPFTLAAPLGCGVLTGAGTVLRALRPTDRDSLLVVGAGTVGLSAVMAGRALGCATITVVEPDAGRRALAIELGADAAVAPDAFDPRATAHDLAIDTVGTQESLDAALGGLASPGVCATVALRPGVNRVTVSQTALLWGRTLVGVIEGDAVPDATIPLLVEMWRAGLLPLERLVVPFRFERVDDAVGAARVGRAVKAVLTFGDEPVPAASGPTVASAADRVRRIAAAGAGDAAELEMLWDLLPAARAADLRGLWHGAGIDTGHRTQQLLVSSRWYGKNFIDAETVQPLVVRDEHGELRSASALAGGAGAWLADAAHRGKVTATMSYDARPLHDHFVRVDADTLLGVMAGRGALDDGRPYYFVLERDPRGEVGPLPELDA